ncbi:MAG: UDP-N-acetylmuramate--L-alanine ligase [Acidimicrobiia bacterium]
MADLGRLGRIHLIGVGGAGMSALAKLLHGWGSVVSGSDLRAGSVVASLAELGIEVWSGHEPERLRGVDLVVASSAVPETDPEIGAAHAAGIPVWRRPRLLEEITSEIPTVGPTGTHGKTTSTAMLVAALRRAGLDPSFAVGGDLIDLGTNAATGEGDLLVLEVDEAFGTFEQIELRGLVVTNVEPEHLEHFSSVDSMEDAFARVVRRVQGPVVVGIDDPGARRLADRTGAAGFGFESSSTWRITDLASEPSGVAFRLAGPSAEIEVRVPRPGRHTALNAAGVLALCGELGIDLEAAAAGLRSFHGVRRRFEVRGTVAGVTVVDDYAHHPTEVAVTVRTALDAGHRRVWAVFQPHLYSRTQRFQRDFGAALAPADRVVVTDVYGSREEPIPGVTGELVAAAAVRAGGQVEYVPRRSELAAHLAAGVEDGDLVLVMGAGDITITAGELLTLLADEEHLDAG